MGRTKKKIVVETIKTIKCDLCQKELKGDDFVYHSRLQTFCGECFKGVLKTKGKIHQLQQRIDKAIEYINNSGWLEEDCFYNFKELEQVQELLEILRGGENNR